jgi:hypothetical protein
MKNSNDTGRIDFAADPKWQELYVLTEHWQSDMEFYKDDLLFLHHLVDKYMIWITRSENLELVKEIMFNVRSLQKRCHYLITEVIEHRHNLAMLEKDATKESWDKVKNDHEVMENSISQFVKEFRANRKEVFRITEYVIDTEELTALLRG